MNSVGTNTAAGAAPEINVERSEERYEFEL